MWVCDLRLYEWDIWSKICDIKKDSVSGEKEMFPKIEFTIASPSPSFFIVEVDSCF